MRISLALMALLSPAASAEAPTSPRLAETCILRAVAEHMGVELTPHVLPPVVRYESRTPLAYFQDAIEPQWKFRPARFTNAYVPARDEIFIIDQAEYYRKLGRFIDDSLAHEYAHFIQVRYRGSNLDTGDDTLEHQAIHVQNWFRERLQAGDGPRELCPSR